MASRRAAIGGVSPASMWPPGCIQMPRRLCRCSTVPRGPTTMPDAVTWVGDACSSHGESSDGELGQEALAGRRLTGRGRLMALDQGSQVRRGGVHHGTP